MMVQGRRNLPEETDEYAIYNNLEFRILAVDPLMVGGSVRTSAAYWQRTASLTSLTWGCSSLSKKGSIADPSGEGIAGKHPIHIDWVFPLYCAAVHDPHIVGEGVPA